MHSWLRSRLSFTDVPRASELAAAAASAAALMIVVLMQSVTYTSLLPLSRSDAGHYEFVFLIGENNVEEIPAFLEKLKGMKVEALSGP